MKLTDAIDLFHYEQWCAHRQREAVAGLSAEDFARNLGSSLGGVRGTLVHIHAARMIWHARWAGEPRPSLPTEDDLGTLAAIEEASGKLHARILSFLGGLDNKKLMAPWPYVGRDGRKRDFLLSQQVRHLINHSTYHRGQITTMLRQLGAEPIRSIDLMAYYEMVGDEDGRRIDR